VTDLEKSWADQWGFARRYNFNHGSLGASPLSVLSAHEKLSREINADREQFTREGGYARVDQARLALCSFLGSDHDNLVFTTNVTESLNTVVKSLALGKGDEILITNHMYVNYPALLEELSERQGFRIVRVNIPYHVQDPAQITDIILAGVTSDTKLAIVDHITSTTAFIFPVQAIVAALDARGVDVFIDGAHAPGQVDIDLELLGAAYYGGNNHKWLCAPLSSGFLYVRPDKQDRIIPAIGSGFARSSLPFIERFSWQGVIDVTPRLMVPETLRLMASLHDQGWEGIYKRNHKLAMAARKKISVHLGIDSLAPESMVGSMFTLPLGRLNFSDEDMAKSPLHRGYDYMVQKYGFGVIFSQFDDDYIVRVTCHLYNNINDYDVLADALHNFVKEHSR